MGNSRPVVGVEHPMAMASDASGPGRRLGSRLDRDTLCLWDWGCPVATPPLMSVEGDAVGPVRRLGSGLECDITYLWDWGCPVAMPVLTSVGGDAYVHRG